MLIGIEKFIENAVPDEARSQILLVLLVLHPLLLLLRLLCYTMLQQWLMMEMRPALKSN